MLEKGVQDLQSLGKDQNISAYAKKKSLCKCVDGEM